MPFSMIFRECKIPQSLTEKYLVIPDASTLVERCTSDITNAFGSSQREALGPQEIPEA